MDPGTPWNLAELDTILDDGLNGLKLSGVNLPYLYVGGWKTMFGWHKEDLDLYSINYLHHGAPKYWYCIDTDSSEDFEKFTKRCFPDKFEKCTEYLRHKNTLVHPVVLRNNGIKLRKIVQKPGEFVVLRATAYHAGFNSGFNIAEAVNFASLEWVKSFANKVKFCNCIKDSVKINMTVFCDSLISKIKATRVVDKTKMIKMLESVQKDDIKAKELFQRKLEYLQQKKDKALENRRRTISRKNKKRVAVVPSRCLNAKRIKSE
jgi:[histone H3]-trimethyl-L-lysine9/36 demethylase